MDPATTVQTLWARIADRDWAGLTAMLAPDIRVQWPSTGESFTGATNFVAVQAEYPEGWSIRVLRIIADGETVVSEVEVPHPSMGATFRAASVWTVRGALVVAGTEYWTLGAEQAPAWRRPYSD